jgi:Flp pilus assembly protein TadG
MHISIFRSKKFHRSRSGQALIESAIIIPFVLTIIFNAINYGYFFYVAQNMSAAVRSGALYSILGGATPYGGSPAKVGTDATDITGVANLIYQDMQGALPSADTRASLRLCSSSVGTAVTAGITKTTCSQIDGSAVTPAASFPAVDADPEAPNTGVATAGFLLNRVDVEYQFNPLIPGAPFGAILLGTPNCALSGGSVVCTFKTNVSMRVMN